MVIFFCIINICILNKLTPSSKWGWTSGPKFHFFYHMRCAP